MPSVLPEFSVLLPKFHDRLLLLRPVGRSHVAQERQRQPARAVARDDGMDDARREVGQTDDSRDVAHLYLNPSFLLFKSDLALFWIIFFYSVS